MFYFAVTILFASKSSADKLLSKAAERNEGGNRLWIASDRSIVNDHDHDDDDSYMNVIDGI